MSDSTRSNDITPVTDNVPELNDGELNAVAGGTAWDFIRTLEDVGAAIRDFLGINPNSQS